MKNILDYEINQKCNEAFALASSLVESQVQFNDVLCKKMADYFGIDCTPYTDYTARIHEIEHPLVQLLFRAIMNQERLSDSVMSMFRVIDEEDAVEQPNDNAQANQIVDIEQYRN